MSIWWYDTVLYGTAIVSIACLFFGLMGWALSMFIWFMILLAVKKLA